MGGFQVKYKELFTVSLRQPFYTNDVCRQYKTNPVTDFDLVPTPESVQLMNRMDMIFRNVDNQGGGIVLARVLGTNGGGDDLLRFPVYSGDKLTFLMVMKNADVLNFNELPVLSGSGQIYYFSNDVNYGGAVRNDLHISNAAAGVQAADAVKKVTGNYSFHKASVISPGNASVQHIRTGLEAGPTSIQVENGESDLVFNLSGLPSGRCKLIINGMDSDEFYYMGSVNTAGKVFGVIELSLSDAIPAKFRIVEPDRSLTKERPLFVVPFVNRKTFWRYTIDMQPSSGLYQLIQGLTAPEKTTFFSEINIVSNDTNVTFKKVVATETQLQFVSVNALPLQERYLSSSSVVHDRLSLTLRKYIGDNALEADVKGNLPYPAVSSLDATNATIYSDIFITI